MSNSYKMVLFPCNCSPDGDCGKGAGLATWFAHTSGTFHLYQKACGEWEKVLALDEWDVEYLVQVSDCDSECIGWGEERDAIEKVRFGNIDYNGIKAIRKDERNKVIEGIFDFVFNYDMELHVMNDILAKLNQLKEQKK